MSNELYFGITQAKLGKFQNATTRLFRQRCRGTQYSMRESTAAVRSPGSAPWPRGRPCRHEVRRSATRVPAAGPREGLVRNDHSVRLVEPSALNGERFTAERTKFMSAGMQLIRAIVERRSRAGMRAIYPELFTPEERPAYHFVADHYWRFGQIPTLEVLTENGFRPMLASGDVDYHIERARRRAVGNALVAEHPALAEAIRRADEDGSIAALDRMREATRMFRTRNDVVTAIDAAELVREDYQMAKPTRACGASPPAGVPRRAYRSDVPGRCVGGRRSSGNGQVLHHDQDGALQHPGATDDCPPDTIQLPSHSGEPASLDNGYATY